MLLVKKSRLSKSFVGIGLALSLLTSGTMLFGPQSAFAAASDSAATAAYSATSTSTSKASSVVRTAKSYIGKVRYKFGVRDTTRLILDCSSFTQLVFKKNGITIPWSSTDQAKLGTAVKKKANLREGDLVFFSTSKPGRINHVGIYVGNGKFVSNTASSGVVMLDMNDSYWKNRFITGRRL
ncbi:C40 family peptidase [Paenibacillus sp. CGMCC 1.16610]|uniref:NlpC/P60 family protein n=1 Tax=Paenibacillus anseongense TaxID=2682845 RepID=A0ABW9U2N9_9BACL|nr:MULTISPECIES: C40 family peptidase [Paenibacillus]MBA2941804.1 C40 family peptidase [Paenibacillus sp. CGMCC 1.16610]MVQ34322.1 NlpC/P60 family protein [Paenibacillus anseongense]